MFSQQHYSNMYEEETEIIQEIEKGECHSDGEEMMSTSFDFFRSNVKKLSPDHLLKLVFIVLLQLVRLCAKKLMNPKVIIDIFKMRGLEKRENKKTTEEQHPKAFSTKPVNRDKKALDRDSKNTRNVTNKLSFEMMDSQKVRTFKTPCESKQVCKCSTLKYDGKDASVSTMFKKHNPVGEKSTSSALQKKRTLEKGSTSYKKETPETATSISRNTTRYRTSAKKGIVTPYKNCSSTPSKGSLWCERKTTFATSTNAAFVPNRRGNTNTAQKNIREGSLSCKEKTTSMKTSLADAKRRKSETNLAKNISEGGSSSERKSKVTEKMATKYENDWKNKGTTTKTKRIQDKGSLSSKEEASISRSNNTNRHSTCVENMTTTAHKNSTFTKGSLSCKEKTTSMKTSMADVKRGKSEINTTQNISEGGSSSEKKSTVTEKMATKYENDWKNKGTTPKTKSIQGKGSLSFKEEASIARSSNTNRHSTCVEKMMTSAHKNSTFIKGSLSCKEKTTSMKTSMADVKREKTETNRTENISEGVSSSEKQSTVTEKMATKYENDWKNKGTTTKTKSIQGKGSLSSKEEASIARSSNTDRHRTCVEKMMTSAHKSSTFTKGSLSCKQQTTSMKTRMADVEKGKEKTKPIQEDVREGESSSEGKVSVTKKMHMATKHEKDVASEKSKTDPRKKSICEGALSSKEETAVTKTAANREKNRTTRPQSNRTLNKDTLSSVKQTCEKATQTSLPAEKGKDWGESSRTKELQTENDKLKQENKQLRDDIEKMQKEKQKRLQKDAQLKEEKQTLAQQLEQKELERKNHLKSLEEKDVWLSTQEKKITELEKEKAKLGTELKEEKKKNGMLHDENVQLGCRCSSLEGENINLRQENRTARESDNHLSAHTSNARQRRSVNPPDDELERNREEEHGSQLVMLLIQLLEDAYQTIREHEENENPLLRMLARRTPPGAVMVAVHGNVAIPVSPLQEGVTFDEQIQGS